MAGDVRVYSSVPSVDLFVEMGPDMPGGSPIVIDDTTRTLYAYLSGGVTQVGGGSALPTLAAVATSGAYGDLSGTPAITTTAYGTASLSVTGVTNISGSAMAGPVSYMQVGNIVTFGGQYYVNTTTAANAPSVLRMTIPVSVTVFSTASQAGGAAAASDISSRGAAIVARALDTRIQIKWNSDASATGIWSFNATYLLVT